MITTLFSIIALFPNTFAQRLGSIVGTLLAFTNNREKRVVEKNIELCFGQLTPGEQSQLVKKSLQENAKTLMELPRIFTQEGERSCALITDVEGIHHYEQALADKNGVILLAPHLGNWELTVHYLNQFATITALYSPPRNEFLNRIMQKGRESTGATLVPADISGVRAQLRCLKKGGVVGILPDQVPQEDASGVFAPFMGYPALTMTLVHNLLKRSEARVLFTFAERLSTSKGYHLHVLPAPEGIYSDDVNEYATSLNSGVAACVEKAPAQYQWTYKRFKKQPNNQPSPYEG